MCGDRVLVDVRIDLRPCLLGHGRDGRKPTQLPAEALEEIAVLDVRRLLCHDLAERPAASEHRPTQRKEAALDVGELAVWVELREPLVSETLKPWLAGVVIA